MCLGFEPSKKIGVRSNLNIVGKLFLEKLYNSLISSRYLRYDLNVAYIDIGKCYQIFGSLFKLRKDETKILLKILESNGYLRRSGRMIILNKERV